MKILGIIVIVVALIVGWSLLRQNTEMPASVVEENTVQEEQSGTNEAPETSDEVDAMIDVESEVSVDTTNEVTNEVSITLDSFNFGYSQEEIRVKEGDVVTINLTNSDGFHDWVVDEFNAATDKISAGNTTSVTFVADKAGSYEYYCSVGSHRANGMVGTLIVE